MAALEPPGSGGLAGLWGFRDWSGFLVAGNKGVEDISHGVQ